MEKRLNEIELRLSKLEAKYIQIAELIREFTKSYEVKLLRDVFDGKTYQAIAELIVNDFRKKRMLNEKVTADTIQTYLLANELVTPEVLRKIDHSELLVVEQMAKDMIQNFGETNIADNDTPVSSIRKLFNNHNYEEIAEILYEFVMEDSNNSNEFYYSTSGKLNEYLMKKLGKTPQAISGINYEEKHLIEDMLQKKINRMRQEKAKELLDNLSELVDEVKAWATEYGLKKLFQKDVELFFKEKGIKSRDIDDFFNLVRRVWLEVNKKEFV